MESAKPTFGSKLVKDTHKLASKAKRTVPDVRVHENVLEQNLSEETFKFEGKNKGQGGRTWCATSSKDF